MTVAVQLKQHVDNLPEPLAREVLDYLVEVAKRHGMEKLEKRQGSLRGRLGHHSDPGKRNREATAWSNTMMAS